MSRWCAAAALFLLGAAASYSDLRDRRVPNRLIAAGLAAATAIFLASAAESLLGYLGARPFGLDMTYLPWLWYARALEHFFLSAAAGWTLWKLGVWPAGDAKLYLTLCWLLPLSKWSLAGFPDLLFLVVLINAFVPAGLVYALEAAAHIPAAVRALFELGYDGVLGKIDEASVRVRELSAHRAKIAAYAINFSAVFLGLRAAQSRLGAAGAPPLIRVSAFLAMYASWDAVSPWLVRTDVARASAAALSLLAVVAAASGRFSTGFLAGAVKDAFGFIFLLMLARSLCHRRLAALSRSEAAVDELRPGTIIDEQSWRAMRRQPALSAILEERYCDGLEARQADALRAALAGGSGVVVVRRAAPFAAWIFIGAALTFWRPGTVVSWVLSAIHAERGTVRGR